MAFALKFGSITLDGIRTWSVSNPYRVTRHYFPRRQGSIAPRVPAKDAKTIICEGDLWKDNRAQVKEYFRLLGKAGDAGRERLVLEDDDAFMNAVLEGVEQRLEAGTAPDVHMPYTLRFVADDPFIYSASQQEQTETVGAANTLTFSITNSGGARTPAVFQVTRTSDADEQANVKLEQTTTGLFMQWAGTLPNGSSVIFDCVNRRVTALGSNGLSTFTGQIRLELEVGLNNFAYTGPGNVTIVAAWLERWGLT
jgi:small nuclear ribonucleoprotein (snRNP)-like protein